MRVRIRPAGALLANQSVVVDEDAGGHGAELERPASRNVIQQVPVEIDRPAENWLRAVAVVGGASLIASDVSRLLLIVPVWLLVPLGSAIFAYRSAKKKAPQSSGE